MAQGRGLLLVASNADIDRADAERREAEQRQNAPLITGLSGHLERLFEAAKNHKTQHITPRLLACKRARNGEYDPDKLAEIKLTRGSEVFMMLTATKCRALFAQIIDVYVPTSNERPWEIEPTPRADLPPYVKENLMAAMQQMIMQQFLMTGQFPPDEAIGQLFDQLHEEVERMLEFAGKMAAQNMARTIEDQLLEGGFIRAFTDFVDDFVTYPYAILKAPVPTKRKSLKWAQVGGEWTPSATQQVLLDVRRVSPWDHFPSPNKATGQSGYDFERRLFSVKSLTELKGTPGIDNAAVDMAISEYARGGLRNWIMGDYERAQMESKSLIGAYAAPTDEIEGLEFWGEVPGEFLVDWGVEGIDKHQSYQITAIKIGRHVIKAVVNPHPLGHSPYMFCQYERVPDSIVGTALPEKIADCQQMCNASARGIANNMGMASGPQVALNDVSRLPPGFDDSTIYPWKIWRFAGDDIGVTSNRPPIEFFQPNPVVDKLMAVYTFFMQLADEYSVPSYTHGDVRAGDNASSTASGLSMLMNQQSKTVRALVLAIDQDVVETMVSRYYDHNMLYSPDKSIKGDLRCKATGSNKLLMKEQQQLRRQEFLANTNNPVDLQITGLPGRAQVLREAAKALDMDVDKIVPNPEDQRDQMVRAALQGGAPNQPGVAAQNTPTGPGAIQPGGGSEMGSMMPDGSPAGGEQASQFNQGGF